MRKCKQKKWRTCLGSIQCVETGINPQPYFSYKKKVGPFQIFSVEPLRAHHSCVKNFSISMLLSFSPLCPPHWQSSPNPTPSKSEIQTNWFLKVDLFHESTQKGETPYMHTERENGVTLDKFPWLFIPQFFSNNKIRGPDLTASVIPYIQEILWFSSFNNGTNDIKGNISIFLSWQRWH